MKNDRIAARSLLVTVMSATASAASSAAESATAFASTLATASTTACAAAPAARRAAWFVSALLAAAASIGAYGLAQNPRDLNNGADVVFIYGDPSIGASAGSGQIDTSGDLYWMVHPRESMLSASGSAEVGSVRFEIYDTDWSTPPSFFDVLFGPGKPNPAFPGNIVPDFGAAGLAASTLLLGSASGFPNPCTFSPGFCTSIGGACTDPALLGYTVDMRLSACDGTGIVLSASNTVDTCVTVFLPGGMTFTTGAPGACGLGDYTLMTSASTDETQADSAATPGYSRYGGFQIGAAPGFNPDAVTERGVYTLGFCDPVINTTIAGDRGLVGLLHDASHAAATLQQVVADAASVGQLCVVSNSVLAPLPAPGIVFHGAGLMLNQLDPIVAATRKRGLIAAATGSTPAQFVPTPLVLPKLPIGVSFTLSAQAFTFDFTSQIARGSLLTQTRVNP